MQERLYSIGEVARLTGLPIKTIRYYADIGLLPPAKTTPARYRLYGAREIWRLELVRTLRYLGFGLDEIRRVLSGELDVATAIDWQLEAIEAQLRQLGRTREILRQARQDVADEERSLRYLHALGQALTASAEERSRFLAMKLLDVIAGSAAPPDWLKYWREAASQDLPNELSPEQAAAWAELVDLLSDPEVVATLKRNVAPFWETVRDRAVDVRSWHEGMAAIMERAVAAARDGAAPDSPRVQAIVDDWIALFARALGRPPDCEFVRQFAGSAGTWITERERRIWELLAILNWGGIAAEQWQAQQLMFKALEQRTCATDPRPVPDPEGTGRERG